VERLLHLGRRRLGLGRDLRHGLRGGGLVSLLSRRLPVDRLGGVVVVPSQLLGPDGGVQPVVDGDVQQRGLVERSDLALDVGQPLRGHRRLGGLLCQQVVVVAVG
jgi:hypothetical protein